MEKFLYGEADLFSSQIIARPTHLQELDSYYLHFSRLCASFRGNAEADLFTVKNHLQHFSLLCFGTLFQSFFQKSIFSQQMPHFAKTFEISPLILKLCISWVCTENTFISVWEVGYPKYKTLCRQEGSPLCFSVYDACGQS